MDFIERLQDTINGIEYMPLICHLGYLKEDESLVLFPSPGSRIIQEYMDGEKEAQMNYTIAMKSKKQGLIHGTLWIIQNELERLGDIKSDNGSFEFNSLDVTNKPFITDADEQGWHVFMLDIQANLTILKGDD